MIEKTVEKLVYYAKKHLYLDDLDAYVDEIDALKIGEAAMLLGAGRATKEDIIDPSVGIVLHKKVGDKVTKGDVIASIYTNGLNTDEAMQMIFDAYVLTNEEVKPHDIILKIVR